MHCITSSNVSSIIKHSSFLGIGRKCKFTRVFLIVESIVSASVEFSEFRRNPRSICSLCASLLPLTPTRLEEELQVDTITPRIHLRTVPYLILAILHSLSHTAVALHCLRLIRKERVVRVEAYCIQALQVRLVVKQRHRRTTAL